jgi:hypothetical protein
MLLHYRIHKPDLNLLPMGEGEKRDLFLQRID